MKNVPADNRCDDGKRDSAKSGADRRDTWGRKGGHPALRRFHDELYAAYQQEMSGDVQVLFKMKELWTYLRHSFVLEEKTEKKLFKAKHLREYDAAVAAVFAANAGVRI